MESIYRRREKEWSDEMRVLESMAVMVGQTLLHVVTAAEGSLTRESAEARGDPDEA